MFNKSTLVEATIMFLCYPSVLLNLALFAPSTRCFAEAGLKAKHEERKETFLEPFPSSALLSRFCPLRSRFLLPLLFTRTLCRGKSYWAKIIQTMSVRFFGPAKFLRNSEPRNKWIKKGKKLFIRVSQQEKEKHETVCYRTSFLTLWNEMTNWINQTT